MPINTFDTLLRNAERAGVVTSKGKESLQWLSSEARKVKTNSSKIIREAEKTELVNWNQLSIGKMYLFFYDSKLYKEDKLPYFDRSPVIFPVDKAPGGFYGVNLHYLPYNLRGKFMDALYEVENNAKFTKNKKLNLSYEVLKGMGKLYKPCFKHYLFTGIKSRALKIGYESWNTAVFLPLASFEGASQNKVFRDSKKKIK